MWDLVFKVKMTFHIDKKKYYFAEKAEKTQIYDLLSQFLKLEKV
jgi:hypothetical protein